MLKIINPAHGGTIAELPKTAPKRAAKYKARARRTAGLGGHALAHATGGDPPLSQRHRRDHLERLAAILTSEVGKPISSRATN
jgi:acyl-CoA reductase-like NAD-dependent aldehyde dehydrogenase